ncbi:MAG: HNH endonuclease signature motif containing protein, partial [Nitriliruptor sp.]|uniref:HNH endonuclease signature motif containing protein n=1 Tax=Nitriliruptor sp. TaxID=2448056 RepID=UPI0034A0613E
SAEEGDGPVWHHQRTVRARLADAVVHAVAAAVAAGGADTTGLDRHTLVLQTTASALTDSVADSSTDSDNNGEVTGPDRQVAVADPRGQLRSMSARALRRIACQASTIMAVTGDDGTPLDLGRRSRDPSASQRRALLLRDRSCRFPGCGATRHLHAHHVRLWSQDGPTDLANLVTVCSFHHRFVHDHAWQVHPAAAGTFRFAPPHGTPLPAARPLHAAAADWWFDPDHGRPLRPIHRDGPHDLDLDTAVAILHQELRLATGTNLGLAA